MSRSNYSLIMEEIEKAKCKSCGGLGHQDDSEPGDISFNTWTCKFCNGTGWKNATNKMLINRRK